MMKTMRIAATFLLICLVLGIAGFAEPADERFENRTWDEVMQQFFDDRGINPDYLAVGYYNTVTGEEHYIDPDTYRMAASLYKLPLNMYFADEIYAGNMDWDTRICGVEYSDIMEMSIVNSSNSISEMLQEHIGSYRDYREAISGYMGVDMQSDTDFVRGNEFTAREMITCLRTLYDGSDRYEKIIDAMKRASQDKFFCNREHPFEIAHKYGYVEYEEHLYVNDCAVVYTTEPILIVLLSDVHNAELWMGDMCLLLTEYAEYNKQPEAEPEKSAPESEEPEPTPTPSPTPAHAVSEAPAQDDLNARLYAVIPMTVAAAAAASGYLIKKRK